jgi:hypothetical protein
MKIPTTRFTIFSVIYSLDLRCAITFYLYLIFTNKGQIGCLDTIEHEHLYLVKTCINTKMD